jgi:hypothetical protein
MSELGIEMSKEELTSLNERRNWCQIFFALGVLHIKVSSSLVPDGGRCGIQSLSNLKKAPSLYCVVARYL